MTAARRPRVVMCLRERVRLPTRRISHRHAGRPQRGPRTVIRAIGMYVGRQLHRRRRRSDASHSRHSLVGPGRLQDGSKPCDRPAGSGRLPCPPRWSSSPPDGHGGDGAAEAIARCYENRGTPPSDSAATQVATRQLWRPAAQDPSQYSSNRKASTSNTKSTAFTSAGQLSNAAASSSLSVPEPPAQAAGGANDQIAS